MSSLSSVASQELVGALGEYAGAIQNLLENGVDCIITITPGDLLRSFQLRDLIGIFRAHAIANWGAHSRIVLSVCTVLLAVAILRRLGRISSVGHKQLISSFRRSGESESRGDVVGGPVPPYLASSIDDDELIGGSPLHLTSPRGPAGVTFTFHVFTPPSFDGEIPKVDFFGAVDFFRTGKIREFIPRGSLRLLILDLKEMTLAVHLPKKVRKIKGKKDRRIKDQDELFDTKGGRRSSGIFISTSLQNMIVEDSDDEEDEEYADLRGEWNPRCFETKPSKIYRLGDLISVAAVPPRHGGVVEILSRSPRKASDNMDSFGERKGKSNHGKCSQHNGKDSTLPLSPKKQPLPSHKTKPPEDKHAKAIDGDEYECVDLPSQNNSTKAGGSGIAAMLEDNQEEFTFRTPCEAAEFQRIIMALRTVGKEVSYLYEKLESISDSHPDEKESPDQFHSPGVDLSDAWHCFSEVPSVRRGLCQYQLLCQIESEKNNDSFHLTRSVFMEAELDDDDDGMDLDDVMLDPHRKRLGLVDFLSLFVPPLSRAGSHAIPCFTPCAKYELGNEYMLTGVEWHHQRLSFVSALQRRLSRAALYVRAYTTARLIAKDGWHIKKTVPRGVREADQKSCGKEAEVSEDAIDDAVPGPIKISNSPSMPVTNNIQGYSCVGWHAFRYPCTSQLRPDTDPLKCIPSLRSIVKQYKHAHFIVISHFSEDMGIAAYFLLVRSLPVGVDREFDDSVRQLSSSDSSQRNKLLAASIQLEPKSSSPMLTKLLFRGCQLTLTRTRGNMVLLSELLRLHFASIWHFGGELEKSHDMPKNYVAINLAYNIPMTAGALKRFVFDFKSTLATFSETANPKRAIASINISNMDLSDVPTSKKVRGVRIDENRAEGSVSITSQSESDVMRSRIDAIYKILAGIIVPIRTRDQTTGDHNQDNKAEVMKVESIISSYTRHDVERYLVDCKCDVKNTVVRLVESAAWRGSMFPVDERMCNIELQSGQFFHQGFDKNGHAIFYFRVMLRGPWRNSIQSSMLAFLHRLESYISKMARQQSNVKFTLVALWGDNYTDEIGDTAKTKKRRKRKDVGDDEYDQSSTLSALPSPCSDPRIDPYEAPCVHSNSVLMKLINGLIPRHYPGRLERALLIPNKDMKSRIRAMFPSQNASSKVTILDSCEGLRKYVNPDELPLFAGGQAQIFSDAFKQCGEFITTGTENAKECLSIMS